MDQPRRRAPRPLTRAQQLENAAFLAELRRTANVREAARRVGAHRAKFTRRRAKHPCFEAQWDEALAQAQEVLAEVSPFEPGLTHLADGRLQLRRPRDHALNPDRRLGFLAMLSQCGSVRFAAECEGFSHAAFHYYKDRDPDFARAWHLALGDECLRREATETGVEALGSPRRRGPVHAPSTAKATVASHDEPQGW